NRVYTHSDGIGYAVPDTQSAKWSGTSVTVCPVVSADGKSVRVRLSWKHATVLPDIVTLNSGSKMKLDSFKDGRPAGPVEVEFRESTNAHTLKSCQTQVRLCDGATVLLDLGRQLTDGKVSNCYLLVTASITRDNNEQ